MSAFLWFAVWAVLIFLMMRFGCGLHVMGHRRNETRDAHGPTADDEVLWEPPETDTDPVCHKTVKTADAKPSVFGGHVYYFCSRDCREIFEAAPHTYVRVRGEVQRLEHEHG